MLLLNLPVSIFMLDKPNLNWEILLAGVRDAHNLLLMNFMLPFFMKCAQWYIRCIREIMKCRSLVCTQVLYL